MEKESKRELVDEDVAMLLPLEMAIRQIQEAEGRYLTTIAMKRWKYPEGMTLTFQFNLRDKAVTIRDITEEIKKQKETVEEAKGIVDPTQRPGKKKK